MSEYTVTEMLRAYARGEEGTCGGENRLEAADLIDSLQSRVVYLEDSLTAGTGSLWDGEVNIFCEIVLRGVSDERYTD